MLGRKGSKKVGTSPKRSRVSDKIGLEKVRVMTPYEEIRL
jgi:hypothetical protein